MVIKYNYKIIFQKVILYNYLIAFLQKMVIKLLSKKLLCKHCKICQGVIKDQLAANSSY